MLRDRAPGFGEEEGKAPRILAVRVHGHRQVLPRAGMVDMQAWTNTPNGVL